MIIFINNKSTKFFKKVVPFFLPHGVAKKEPIFFYVHLF